MEDKTFIKARVTGTYTETEERIKSDKSLLNIIERERIERMEATRDTNNQLQTLGKFGLVIHEKLRRHEIVLRVYMGIQIVLIIVIALIIWQTLN